MKLKQKVLIIGGSVLFAVPGCDDGGEDPMTTGDQGTIPRDSMVQDDTGPSTDSALADSSVIIDMSVEMDGGDEPEDMGTAFDSGAVEPDAMTLDMSVVLPDMSILDAAMPQDMAVIIPDAAIGPDEGAPAGACADLVGTPCENFSIGCCENNEPVLLCRGEAFVPYDGDLPCGCTMREGIGEVACAVPGFVGIHRANVSRQRARRLRDLLS